MKRDILNYLGQKIGEIEFPDDTSEEVIQNCLAMYATSQEVDTAALYRRYSIEQRQKFCHELIQRFKDKNLQDGINAMQAFHLQHRMRALDVTFMGVPFVVDIMNLVISGDVEVGCLALLYCQPDDMSLPYHWFSTERRNWLVAEMKSYLGWA